MVKPEKWIERSNRDLGHMSVIPSTDKEMDIVVDRFQALIPVPSFHVIVVFGKVSIRGKIRVCQGVIEQAPDVFGCIMLLFWNFRFNARDKPGHRVRKVLINLITQYFSLTPLSWKVCTPHDTFLLSLFLRQVVLVFRAPAEADTISVLIEINKLSPTGDGYKKLTSTSSSGPTFSVPTPKSPNVAFPPCGFRTYW